MLLLYVGSFGFAAVLTIIVDLYYSVALFLRVLSHYNLLLFRSYLTLKQKKEPESLNVLDVGIMERYPG